MSGFEVLGIACSIFQTISFAHEVYSTCRDFYDDGPVPLDHLEWYGSKMDESAEALRRIVAHSASRDDQAGPLLEEAITTTQDVAKKLSDLVNHVTAKRAAGRSFQAIRTFFRYKQKKRDIDQLDTNLTRCQQLVNGLLITKQIQKADAARLAQSDGFAQLSTNMKEIIHQIAGGRGDVKDLSHSYQMSMQAFIKDELETIQFNMREIISSQAAKAQDQEEARKSAEKLLESLSCPDATMRGNEIDKLDKAVYSKSFFGMQDGDSTQDDSAHHSTAQCTHGSDPCMICSIDLQEDIKCRESWSQFYSWLESPSDDNLFWISGRPGSGKSTLMKYLINAERTLTSLQQWAGAGSYKVQILSHYFWKIGVPLQNNQRGFLCSILYQILSQEERNTALFQLLLSTYKQSRVYRSCEHWPEKVLRGFLTTIIKSQLLSSSYCLFIDGLDEISDREDVEEFLIFLRNLSLRKRIKICVSSRPERRFREALSLYPQLALHELTRRSMRRYIRQELPATIHLLPDSAFHIKLDEALIDKAEGVFLWLYLVVDSLQRGAKEKNSQEEMADRVSQLPSDLLKLYQHMWKRLGDDQKIYQKTAARYINLMLTYHDIYTRRRSRGWGNMSALMLLLANYPEAHSKFINAITDTDIQALGDWCALKLQEIETHCVGLLKIEGNNGTRMILEMTSPASSPPELERSTWQVSFIHRTAFEFFTETEEGRNMTENDVSTFSERALALSQAISITMAFWGSPEVDIECDEYFRASIACIEASIKKKSPGTSDREVLAALTLAEDVAILAGGGGDFTCFYIEESSLLKFLLDHTLLDRTSVFREFWSGGFGKTRMFNTDFVPYMLQKGADPSEKGIIRGSIFRGKNRELVVTCLRSAWANFLDSAFYYTEKDDVTGPSYRLSEMATIMSQFLRASPDMSERVSFVVRISQHNYSRPSYLCISHNFSPYDIRIAGNMRPNDHEILWVLTAQVSWFCDRLLNIFCQADTEMTALAEEVRGLLQEKRNLCPGSDEARVTAILWDGPKTTSAYVSYPSEADQTRLAAKVVALLPKTSKEKRKIGGDWGDQYHKHIRASFLAILDEYLDTTANAGEAIDKSGVARVLSQHLGGIPAEQLDEYPPLRDPPYCIDGDRVWTPEYYPRDQHLHPRWQGKLNASAQEISAAQMKRWANLKHETGRRRANRWFHMNVILDE